MIGRKTMLPKVLSVCLSVGFLASRPLYGIDDSATGYFVSIDSLRGDHVKILSDAGVLSADHGIGWLYKSGARADKAWPVEITLTAPSHVSTITCSRPHAHGIIANSFMVGAQKVNGFSYDIRSETFWEAAKRQGKKVLAIAYVGADGKNDRRKADVGISYPSDTLVGKAQALRWDPAALVPAQDWTAPSFIDLASSREASVILVINGQTLEQRVINVLFAGGMGANRVYLDDDKDLTNGSIGSFDLNGPRLQVLDSYTTEQNPASPIVGFKKRVRFTLLDSQNGVVSVYASTATYNNAYPEQFRRYLDDHGQVWVDPYVPSNAGTLSPGEYVKTTLALDNFLAEAVLTAQSQYIFDAVLFYLFQHKIYLFKNFFILKS